MTTLPNKLSDLLELAVRDAQACESQPEKFYLRMGDWMRLSRSRPGVCEICMAGAIMVNTMGLQPTEDDPRIEPGGVDKMKLWAVDSMRSGDFRTAYAEFHELGDMRFAIPDAIGATLDACEALVGADRDDGEVTLGRASWETYLDCASDLREAGL